MTGGGRRNHHPECAQEGRKKYARDQQSHGRAWGLIRYFKGNSEESGAGEMRPRLRDDVRYVKCPEGVYVHAQGGACTLKGAHSYEWLSRLAPHLTGEHTLDDLVGSLTADQRAMVEGLVGTLSEQRFVVDVVSEEPYQLDAEDQRVYAAEIAFIARFRYSG